MDSTVLVDRGEYAKEAAGGRLLCLAVEAVA
jgi:hypothetical protein